MTTLAITTINHLRTTIISCVPFKGIPTKCKAMKLSEQIRHNLLAIISLFVALSALGYNTWRNESSEANRNVRQAGFEIIMHVGELQKIAYLSHFFKDKNTSDPKLGWTEVLLLKDLSHLMSASVQSKTESLQTVWEENWQGLGKDNEFSVAEIDLALHQLRAEVLSNMKQLE